MRDIRLQHISIDHSFIQCVLLLLDFLLNQRHEIIEAGIRDQYRRLEHEQILIRGSRRRNRGHVILRPSRNVLSNQPNPDQCTFLGWKTSERFDVPVEIKVVRPVIRYWPISAATVLRRACLRAFSAAKSEASEGYI